MDIVHRHTVSIRSVSMPDLPPSFPVLRIYLPKWPKMKKAGPGPLTQQRRYPAP